MNRKGGMPRTTVLARGGAPFVTFCLLIAVFLPLPLFVFALIATIALAVVSRAAPAPTATVPCRFPAPPSLRSPPL